MPRGITMRSNSLLRNIALILIGAILSLFGGWGISRYGVDFRYLLYLILFIALIAIILTGKKALRTGLIIWIWLFLLGYRTIHISANFPLHPLIVFLAILFLILIFTLMRIMNFQNRTHHPLPCR